MKLFDMSRAPNPRRVRMFLAEKKLDIPKVEVNLVDGDNLKPDYLKVNPRGLVPALQLDDGTVLDESVAICRYLEELHPEPNLLGRDSLARAQIESWQRHIEFDGFLPLLEHFRNTFPAFAESAVPGISERFDAIPAVAERGKRRYQLFLDKLNAHLADREFICGKQFSIADITAFCTTDFSRIVKLGIPEQHTHSRRWYEAVGKRPSAAA